MVNLNMVCLSIKVFSQKNKWFTKASTIHRQMSPISDLGTMCQLKYFTNICAVFSTVVMACQLCVGDFTFSTLSTETTRAALGKAKHHRFQFHSLHQAQFANEQRSLRRSSNSQSASVCRYRICVPLVTGSVLRTKFSLWCDMRVVQ